MERRNLFFIIGGIAVLTLLFFGAYRLFFGKEKEVMGALQITSTPKATVFLNGENKGTTPYMEKEVKPGEYTVKLAAEAGEGTEWMGKVKVVAETLTYINRFLGQTAEESAGEILGMEELSSKEETELAVVTAPSGAGVKVDGVEKGTSPILLKDVVAGDHEVSVEAVGFEPRTMRIRTVAGFKLTASVDLAKKAEEEKTEVKEEEKEAEGEKEEELTPTPKPEKSPTPKTTPTPKIKAKEGEKYLVILETPTGFLRVRSGAGTENEEVARVKQGERYPYSEVSENNWYHIRYEEDKDGWVSGTYVEAEE